MDENYNSLKEMVMDEGKLVTYVSTSKDLCIHVNESKRLLGQLVEHIKKSQPDIVLNINYIVSGLTQGNHAITTVCSEADISSIRQKLKTIFFEHIYSVGKGSQSVDNVALMSVSNFEDFPLCTGLIKSSVCVRHSKDEISNLKSNSQEIAVANTRVTNTQNKIKDVKKEINRTTNGESSNHVKISETKETNIKTEPSSPPKIDKKSNKSATKGIAGFFSKTNGVAAKKSSNSSAPPVVKQEKDDKPPEVKQGKPTAAKVEKIEVDKEPAKQISKTTHKDSESKAKNKNLNSIKKNAKVDKKRKRVLQVSDSESEDEKSDPFADSTPVNNQAFESDDEIPPTPAVNTVKITSGIVNPKKRRKIVDKTYTDEDGYILTKKEEVYESCSDNDMEVETKENKVNQVKLVSPSKKPKIEMSPSKKQNGTKNGKKKVSPPQKGKQATLMSFFKKV